MQTVIRSLVCIRCFFAISGAVQGQFGKVCPACGRVTLHEIGTVAQALIAKAKVKIP